MGPTRDREPLRAVAAFDVDVDEPISAPASGRHGHGTRGPSTRWSYSTHKAIVLALTFWCYAGYHAARKCPSVIKSVLRGDIINGESNSTAAGAGWAPFNGPNGTPMLGELDLAFLSMYATGLFFSGHIGDRVDLRLFLTAGSLLTALFTALYGMGYFWGIHSFFYYVLISAVAGIVQSTGWPSVISTVGHWTSRGDRGLVMGAWTSSSSVGNMVGTVLAAAVLDYGWGWSFLLPAGLMALLGVLVFFFLVVHPQDVGLQPPAQLPTSYQPALVGEAADAEEGDSLLGPNSELNRLVAPANGARFAEGGLAGGPKRAAQHHSELEGIAFLDAWRIPGVAPFAFCLFFSKLIAYTFLFWLPYYLKNTEIEGRVLSPREAGNLSVLWDVGAVAGGIVAGLVSDRTGMPATVAAGFTALSLPAMILYRELGDESVGLNVCLMVITGMFVSGPVSLITTAVAADLGTHESLQGNAKALATVSAIIDGVGSIGAAIGPLMTGFLSGQGAFIMLYLSALAAGLLLTPLLTKEVAAFLRTRAA